MRRRAKADPGLQLGLLFEERVRVALAVSGSRDWADAEAVRFVLEVLPRGSTVLEGECPLGGADIIAKRVAIELGHLVEAFPPARDLRLYPFEGPIRNHKMLGRLADYRRDGWWTAIAAFPLPQSRGTRGVMASSQAYGLRCFDCSTSSGRLSFRRIRSEEEKQSC